MVVSSPVDVDADVDVDIAIDSVDITLRNYSTTCVHTRLCSHMYILPSISLNMVAGTNLRCCDNNSVIEEYDDIYFVLIE